LLSLKKFLIPAALAGSALLIAACGGSSSSSSPAASKPSSAYGSSASASSAPAPSSSVKLTAMKGPMGTYLVGSSNRALYLWAADATGKSSCAGACAKFWPPLLASSVPQVADGVNASEISLITRADGQKQVAYKGHPLYYFAEDSKSDPTKGQGNDNFGAKWWLVTPSGAAITTTASSSGGSATASASGSSSGSSSASSNGSSSSGSSGGGGGWG
jgi:predicted lipoprotein with Yx(FWY)xxD motif